MTATYAYSEFFENIKSRLDYVAYNPERIKFFNMLLRKGAIPLEKVCDPSDEFIEPINFPDMVFRYVGLEDVESDTGEFKPKELFGREILSKCRVFKKGQIVFGRLRPYLNKVFLVNEDGLIGSSEFYAVEPKEWVNKKFLLKYLLSSFTLEQTKWALTGSSLPRLDETDFKNLLVIIPENQVAVLEGLKEFESKISSAKVEIKKILDSINELIISEFSIEIPSSRPSFFFLDAQSVEDRINFTWYDPYIRTILNQLEKKNYVLLGDTLEENIEYGVNAFGKEEGKIPFVNIENLNLDGRIHAKGIRFVDEVPESKYLKEGDILISRSRLTGVCVLVSKKEKDFTYGSYILRLRLRKNSNVNPLYLVHYLNSTLGQIQMRWLETGSTGCNINPEQLKQIRIITNKNSDSITKEIQSKLEKVEILEAEIDKLSLEANKKFKELILS